MQWMSWRVSASESVEVGILRLLQRTRCPEGVGCAMRLGLVA